MDKLFIIQEGYFTVNKALAECEVEIDLTDIFVEIEDDELIDEVVSRGLETPTETIVNSLPAFENDRQFTEFICDYLQLSYQTNKDVVIQKLVNKLDDTFLARYIRYFEW